VSPADELQKVFKTLSDPTRVRILRLLDSEELVVQELMQILGMAQSRVSRHLAILREAGLLEDRRDGTYVFYRFVPPPTGSWREAWKLVSNQLRNDPTSQRDLAALAPVLEARSEKARSFFDAVGPEWDALRKVFQDDVVRSKAVAKLVTPPLRVADIGTGTGVLAVELARLGLDVIAVDSSPRMLQAARGKLEAAEVASVDLRRGDAHELPLEDGEVDAVFGHMVLHSLRSPQRAIREMARVVKPGGRVVLVDFVHHDDEWMREELGVLWLGFELEEIRGWLAAAGLELLQLELLGSAGRGRGREIPDVFIASASRR